MKMNFGRWSDYIVLLLIISVGIALRLISMETKYPIGWDSGAYLSYTVCFAKTWPIIPKTVPTIGIIATTTDILPIQPWLMAGFYRISGLDIFTVIKITPLLLCAFTATATYFLAKEICHRRNIALLAAFFNRNAM